MKTWVRAAACALPLAGLALVAPARADAPAALAADGEHLFFEQGCYGCHTVGRVGTPIGPDLSRLGRKYSEAQLIDWLRDPASQKPQAHMPKIELTAPEVRALAAWLASLG